MGTAENWLFKQKPFNKWSRKANHFTKSAFSKRDVGRVMRKRGAGINMFGNTELK